MNIKNNILKILVILCVLLIIPINVNATDNKVTTIVLNPGHGENDEGCSNRSKGLIERDINLKIARYLKAELLNYANVKVILTHDGVNFPNDDSGDLAARAMVARNNNADLYVSLHINDFSDHEKKGASVYITSRTELPKYNEGMTKLGNMIIDELCKLGLTRELGKGLYTRLSERNEPAYKYYDGSQGDYYADIRCAMRGDTKKDLGSDFSDGSGIPTVLVEHCYINNSDDLQFLDSDEDLQKLAKADANAIVKYFGLKLQEEYTIILEKVNQYILKGKTTKLIANLTPQWETNKTIEWTSSAPEIASVTQEGVVTANKAGSATITVTWKEQDLSDSMVINVVELPESTSFGFGSYKKESNRLSNIGPNVKLEDFLTSVSVSDNLKVEIKTVNSNQEYIGTNTRVIIKEKEHGLVVDEYNCVIYADVNGDGKISTMDYTLIKNHIMDVKTINDNNTILAADVSGDGKISTMDYTLIKNHIMDVKPITVK